MRVYRINRSESDVPDQTAVDKILAPFEHFDYGNDTYVVTDESADHLWNLLVLLIIRNDEPVVTDVTPPKAVILHAPVLHWLASLKKVGN